IYKVTAIERLIQTVKSTLKKCYLDKKDLYLALLDLRNIPVDCDNSPANILMPRNLRTLFPQVKQNFKSKLCTMNE
ncbi:hypothetical protein HHI36_010006, partial [Cryptolaemus montrouzieri]